MAHRTAPPPWEGPANHHLVISNLSKRGLTAGRGCPSHSPCKRNGANMAKINGIAAIDTLIGFRGASNIPVLTGVPDAARANPVGYLFTSSPKPLDVDDPEAAVAETIAKMDAHGIERGMASLSMPATLLALRKHPDRFIASLPVDGNNGMAAVESIQRAVDEFGIKAVTTFPAGVTPQLPIDHKRWYPIYAKCCELDLAVFITTGIPGPRVPMRAQHVELLDEVCYDFPDLRIVMRHGGEPWTDLAVKLMLRWPNLYYSTSAFAPKHYPKAIIDYANSRGAGKIIFAGYYPFGLEMERVFSELEGVPFKDEVWPLFLRENALKALSIF